MSWTHRTENLCQARKFSAWQFAMWRELMSSLALSMLLATGAVAQELSPTPRTIPRCAKERADIVKILEEDYDEHQVALGVHPDGLFVLEVYSTPNGSTWTLLTTTAKTGLSCVSGAGKHWTIVTPELGDAS